MHKKDYERFAELLSRARAALRSGSPPLGCLDVFEYELCKLFARENALFDARKFCNAAREEFNENA